MRRDARAVGDHIVVGILVGIGHILVNISRNGIVGGVVVNIIEFLIFVVVVMEYIIVIILIIHILGNIEWGKLVVGLVMSGGLRGSAIEVCWVGGVSFANIVGNATGIGHGRR